MKRLLTVVAAITVLGTMVSAQACGNPEKIMMKIMKDQGLTLLQPARDYVRVGGIVVAPKSGRPEYVDPLDKVPDASGTVVDVKAIVAGQTQKGSTGLGLALSGLGKLVALPVGLTYSSSRMVTLQQMDLGGNRLVSKGVNALAAAAETSKLAKAEIAAGHRVFVVQEVYNGTQLSLISASDLSLGASLGKGGAIPTCTLPGPKKNEAGATPAAPAAQQGGTAKPAETKATDPAKEKPAETAKEKPAETAKEKAADPAKEKAAAGTGDGDKGHSVGVCHASEKSLTITSTAPIGFAVRLAELQVVNNVVSVKHGAFKFPNSLGSSETEQITATVGNDTLQGMRRRARR